MRLLIQETVSFVSYEVSAPMVQMLILMMGAAIRPAIRVGATCRLLISHDSVPWDV